MPSKYDVHFGLGDDIATKLLEVEPELQGTNTSISAVAKRILTDYAYGKIIDKSKIKYNASDAKDRLIEARIKDLEANTKLKIIEIQYKLVHEHHKDPALAVEVANGRMSLDEIGIKNPLDSTNVPIPPTPPTMPTPPPAPAKMPVSIWDESENQLVCNECSPRARFEYRYGIVTEMVGMYKEFLQHIQNFHGRQPNESEQKILDEYVNYIKTHHGVGDKIFESMLNLPTKKDEPQ